MKMQITLPSEFSSNSLTSSSTEFFNLDDELLILKPLFNKTIVGWKLIRTKRVNWPIKGDQMVSFSQSNRFATRFSLREFSSQQVCDKRATNGRRRSHLVLTKTVSLRYISIVAD